MRKVFGEKFWPRFQGATIIAIVFLVPVAFGAFQFNFNSFTLFKSALFKSLVVLSLGTVLAGVLWTGKIKYKKNDLYVWGLLALVVATAAISTYFSIFPEVSFWGEHHKQFGFLSLLSYILFFGVIFLTTTGRKRLHTIIVAIGLSSFLVSVYGVLQYLAFDPWQWREAPFLTGRVFSTLGQPNFLGHFLVMVIPLTVFGLFFVARRSWSRVFFAVTIVLQLTALVLTMSRGAWLALAASALAAGIGYLIIRGKKRVAGTATALILLLAVVGASISFVPGFKIKAGNQDNKFLNRLIVTDINQGSVGARLNYWQSVFKEFRDTSLKRKVVGFGPDTSVSVFIENYQKEWEVYNSLHTIPKRAHNLVLDIWLQFGLLGLLVFVLFFGFLLWKSVAYLKNHNRNRDEYYWLVFTLLMVWCGYAVNNLVSFSNVTTYVYFYLILGILAAIVLRRPQWGRQMNLNLSFPSRVVLAGAFLIPVLIIIFYYNVNWVRADRNFMQAQKIVSSGMTLDTCPIVLDQMEKAHSFYPYNLFYLREDLRYTSGCLSLGRKQRDAIRGVLLSRIESIPDSKKNYKVKFRIAESYMSLARYYNGYYSRAEDIYEELIEVNPELTLPYKNLARIKIKKDNPGEAVRLVQRELELLPSYRDPLLNREHSNGIKRERSKLHHISAQAYRKMGEIPRAIESYKQASFFAPWQMRYYSEIAKLYEKQGQWDKALKYYKKGYKMAPDDYFWPLRIGLMHKKRGNKNKALVYLREASNLKQENKKIKELIQEWE